MLCCAGRPAKLSRVAGGWRGKRRTCLAIGRHLNPLVVLGVPLLLDCRPRQSIPTPNSSSRHGGRSGKCVHAADTENSRCGGTCCHLWHANGDGFFAAADVNWRAARAIESLAAIICAVEYFVWMQKIRGKQSCALVMQGHGHRQDKGKVELLRGLRKGSPLSTTFCDGETNVHLPPPPAQPPQTCCMR